MNMPALGSGARNGWLIALSLSLLWGAGLFGRGYWTPDEPREAALAASVSAQLLPLPLLNGTAFAEKPPLTYWLAGASMARFGSSAPAARLPQLLYALLAFLSVVALARALLGQRPGSAAIALAAGAVFATSALVCQVQIWLDTDALLLAGVCLALAGMYHALVATARNTRWRAYLAMHAGLTLAFFGKNFAAWLVPVLAFLGFMAWERRWRELLRREFWLGALLPLTCIAAWVLAVAAGPDGAASLRVLFWNNLVGRVMPIAAEARFDYASGHPNWPGRYLFELPLYLLPWTALALYALPAAWHGARVAGPARAAWRFALCTAVPGLAVLSLAATGRSIYAAPCMIGFALLIALYLAACETVPGRRIAGAALPVTALLIALFALLVLAITVALQFSIERAAWPQFLLSALSAVVVIAVAAGRARQRGTLPSVVVTQLAATWCLLLSFGVLSIGTAVNRAQDIAALAAGVEQAAASGPLLLWNPDETTLAWAQLYLPAGRWTALEATAGGEAALQQRLNSAPRTAIVSMIDARRWSRAQWLAYLQGRATAAALSSAGPGGEPVLSGAGLREIARVVRPGGRGYLIWHLKR